MENKKFKLQSTKSKFPNVKITLKITNRNGNTYSYRSGKVKRIYSILKHEGFSEALLKVDYGKGFYNSGIYKNNKDLIFALKAFSEKSLVDYFRS